MVSGGVIRWRTMAVATASISAVGIAIGLTIPLLSTILELRGYSATMIGLNTATAGLASLAAAPIATPLARHFGVVPLMLASIAITALALGGFYVANSFWLWFPLRAIFHAALTILFILSEFWIAASAPPERRGLVLGVYATVLSLGFALGPWLFSVLGSSGPTPFAAGVILVAAAALPVIAASREGPVIGPSKSGGNILRHSLLVPSATAAVLLFGAVETGGFALFPVFGARTGYGEADAALLISMIGLGNVLLQIPIGMISDRMRSRRWMLIILALVGLVGMLLLPFFAHSWNLLAAVLFFWGGAVAGLYTVGLAHLGARLDHGDLAAANAAFVFCYSIGMLAGPQIIGIGMDLMGPNGFAWTLAAFFLSYLAVVSVRLKQRP